jgi:Carboxypeptidase regulatory-like domain/Kelch motif
MKSVILMMFVYLVAAVSGHLGSTAYEPDSQNSTGGAGSSVPVGGILEEPLAFGAAAVPQGRSQMSRKFLRRLGVALAAVATAGLAVAAPAPAHAAAPGPGSKADSVRALCAGPQKKGELSCFALARTDIAGRTGVLAPHAAAPAGYGPADLQSAYALPSATGGGSQTVAIVDAYDNPNAEADLAVYRAQFGLPPCTTANGCFSKVNQVGLSSPLPTPDAGWAAEISLDVQMVSATCPNCHILLVEANSNLNTDLYPAVNTAVTLGARFVSNSWGGSENIGETDSDAFFNHPGVAITVSSGDSGFGVSYPASSKYVTAVGGTTLTRAGTGRGWAETAWNGAGSGCSLFEDKPAFQTDPDCAKRSVADVSAIGDPHTGVAVYNTFQAPGWQVYGGTSVSSPIVAGTYALAGTPVAGTYPNTYPYATPSALNDVTSGSNGSCGNSYLCTAVPGYDGPTGLGTPNGVRAFAAAGPHGELVGTVSDASNGKPVASAAVSVSGAATTTDANGHYDLALPAGTYDVSAAAYGFAPATVTGVAVTNGATTTTNIPLTPIPKFTVSGVVKDGSGHGWPLYAKITVDGVPGGPVWSDPVTGRYHVDLASGSAYTLHVTPNYPGYKGTDVTIPAGTNDVALDLPLTVDADSCSAPGYTRHYQGLVSAFDAPTAPAGWTVVNNTEFGGWTFTDDGKRGNLTGGDGGFAIIDSDHLGSGHTEDTELRTPVVDLSAQTAPVIGFNQDYRALSSVADVDLSIDGGQTWNTVAHQTDSVRGPLLTQIPIPQAAGQSAVQVRFHYTGTWAWWWELDNVFVGRRTCDPVHGGLLLGQVTDQNTGQALNGAKVTDTDAGVSATTAPTPDDPNLGDGFYWMFSPVTGTHPVSADRNGYTGQTRSVDIATDFTTRADFALGAGHLVVTGGTIDKTVKMGDQKTATFKIRNDGTAPADVQLNERSEGATILKQQGAPKQVVSGTFNRHQLPGSLNKPNHAAAPAANPYAAPWTDLPGFPTAIMDNGVAVNEGKIYSVGGTDGNSIFATGFAFDPIAGQWYPIAGMSLAREMPNAAVIGGRLYVVGGWGGTGDPVPTLEIYDPLTNTWSTGANVPVPLAAGGVSVLNGRMYVVGGCDTNHCGHPEVFAYDPPSNSWTRRADYPSLVSWESCGTLSGQLYCAGGTSDAGGDTAKGYVYNATIDTWSPITDLPMTLWASGYTAANGMLLVSGGVSAAGVTNQGFAYDPVTRAWTALPNANNTLYRGGSACGFYKVGGSTGGFNPVKNVETLPGFNQCGPPADVPWLSANPTSFTIAPKTTVTVTVTLDASMSAVSQPGTYKALLTLQTNTPYRYSPVNVTMNVTPPNTWGKITGTVVGVKCDGSTVPLAGATVQIDTWAAHYTLKTDANGGYALWLDHRNNPLSLIVAMDGWQPQARQVKITARDTTTADFKLPTTIPCN